MTNVERIDMSTTADLAQAIIDVCEIKEVADFKLVSSFTYQTQLVMIFQKTN